MNLINAEKCFPEHQCNVVVEKRYAKSNSVINF